jgi:ClpP class serine protease
MEALDTGLIDEIGSFDSAIMEAVSLAGISDTKYGIIALENEMDSTQLITKSFITSLSKIKINDNRSFTKNNTLKDLDIYFEKIVGLLSAFNDPKAIYAFCFCDDF